MAKTSERPKKRKRKPTPPTGNPMGRPPKIPTAKMDEMRGKVQAFRIAGYVETEIAKFLGCSPATLRRRFAAELANAEPEFLASVANALGRNALGANAVYDREGKLLRAEIKPDTTAQIFILKVRRKWSERMEHELSGPGGMPLRMGSLTDAQLDQLVTRIETALGSSSG